MRVLHIHSGNLYGGVETLLVTLARQRDLCPQMEPHYALCFEGRLTEELRATHANVYTLGSVRVRLPLSVMRARRALSDLLQREHFDLAICHSSWSQSLFGPVVRSAQLPLVFWLHGQTNGRHWLDRWGGLTAPDLMLCNSQFTASTSSSLYSQVRTEVVYCPVAPPERAYSEADRKAPRVGLETPEEATVVIQISRMEPGKGHALHLEALSKLKDVPGWVCWQVGGVQRPSEIQYLDGLKKTAARLGIAERVRFLGNRSDVARLLAAADIYCQPNTGPEGFGITFIEALYARLPVVTTAIGGACEIVDDSCGVLVPTQDAGALAESLGRLIEDRTWRTKLAANGPTRARELCDPATQMEGIAGLLASTSNYPTALSIVRRGAAG